MAENTYVEQYNAVLDALAKYNEGGAAADSVIMRQGFHSDAVVFTSNNGTVSGGAAQQTLFDVIDTAFSPSSPTAAVVSVDIVGDAASARIDTDNLDGYRFTDFFHLLKEQGEWKIISKIYYTHSGPSS